MNKPLALATLLLAACTSQTAFLTGVPELPAGDDIFWAYYCDSGAELQINYPTWAANTAPPPNSKKASACCRAAAHTTSTTVNTAGRVTTVAVPSASATATKPCTANAARAASSTRTRCISAKPVLRARKDTYTCPATLYVANLQFKCNSYKKGIHKRYCKKHQNLAGDRKWIPTVILRPLSGVA